jgi:hypothetical protein
VVLAEVAVEVDRGNAVGRAEPAVADDAVLDVGLTGRLATGPTIREVVETVIGVVDGAGSELVD